MNRRSASDVGKCDILVVDDEESFRLLIPKGIQRRIPNARIMTAADGGHGYELASIFRPHIVWTCIKMPRMDGLEMIKLIRENPNLKNAKVLVFTGFDSQEMRKCALVSGADIFVSKSSSESFEEALSVVTEWFKKLGLDSIDEVYSEGVKGPAQDVEQAGEETGLMDDPWSKTNKIKCKRCGQYNPIERSIGSQEDAGQVEWFADFYTCSYCGHRGRRLIHQIAKRKDDAKKKPCDNAKGVFYKEDIS